jgi:hypothetical protein
VRAGFRRWGCLCGWEAPELTPEPGTGAQLAEDVTQSQASLPGRLGGHRKATSLGPAAAGSAPAERLATQVQLIDRRQSHPGLAIEDVCQGSSPDYGVQ